jgi:hypothetical protein
VRTDRPLERADEITDETMESATLVAYSRAQGLFEPLRARAAMVCESAGQNASSTAQPDRCFE